MNFLWNLSAISVVVARVSTAISYLQKCLWKRTSSDKFGRANPALIVASRESLLGPLGIWGELCMPIDGYKIRSKCLETSRSAWYFSKYQITILLAMKCKWMKLLNQKPRGNTYLRKFAVRVGVLVRIFRCWFKYILKHVLLSKIWGGSSFPLFEMNHNFWKMIKLSLHRNPCRICKEADKAIPVCLLSWMNKQHLAELSNKSSSIILIK